MRVAIVHYWLVGMRGGERVLESLLRMFPDADLYTHVLDRGAMSETILRHRIVTTFIQRLPFGRRWYQKYLPLMPMALEALDLTGYDLIISNEAGPAKGVIPAPEAVHLCYVNSPMRYVWDKYYVYNRMVGFPMKQLMLPIANYLRIWDATSAMRVDRFVANSSYVAQRVSKYYRREVTVVAPPVAAADFSPVPLDEIEDYYLWAGELVSYKRPDLAIEAFRNSGRRLVVIGDGAERKRLERTVGNNISFLGKVSFDTLRYHMAHCRALVFPGDEDFGIIPLEVQASGRPVIAYSRGGVLDTVIDNETGILYAYPDGLEAALDRFDASGLSMRCRDACMANAHRFTEHRFQAGIAAALAKHGIAASPSAVPSA